MGKTDKRSGGKKKVCLLRLATQLLLTIVPPFRNFWLRSSLHGHYKLLLHVEPPAEIIRGAENVPCLV